MVKSTRYERRNPLSPAQREKLKYAIVSYPNESRKAQAAAAGCTEQTVRAYAKKLGLLRKRGRPKTVKLNIRSRA